MPSTDMETFRKVLKESKNIIVVAGAGLSAASGLSTFRGQGGYWRRFQAMSLATPRAFDSNPSRVWQFYHYRRESALRVKPNAAHYALARFTSPQVREAHCAPESTFTLITQNVDGLSPERLRRYRHQSPFLRKQRTARMSLKCTADYLTYLVQTGTEKVLEASDNEVEIPVDQLPRCEACGELARPGVVWFEEIPHHLDLIEELAEAANLCIVVGTSSTVYPAAGYASLVKDCGGKVAVFNLERTSGDEDSDFLFLALVKRRSPLRWVSHKRASDWNR
ncbi:hypothetical protein D9756_000846 [Leucocoprinus leucothites]|uniref:Deacetylase sirtuin-type domain-containing protein n=1 Tax=Leucocoprinus leucothites TaxID=201217 RepID=A0A8H5GF69_9AGAR|nr:hypothetical protein D9756_000846 [Leucoagaricus leucothites]